MKKRSGFVFLKCMFLVLFIVLAGAWAFFYSNGDLRVSGRGRLNGREDIPPLASEKLPPHGSRLLIIAPHCDDETIGAGIVIHRAVQAGLAVKVVLVTNGDGFTVAVDKDFLTLHPTSGEFREFGYQRQAETLRALNELGLKPSDVIFLGYPDGGIAHLWNEFWDSNNLYYDGHTGTNVSPYRNSFTKNAPYSGVSLAADLDRIISDYKPTDIYYPHPNDRHPDHWGVNAFVKYVLEERGLYGPREHLYLVHRGFWPKPMKPLPVQQLVPPGQLAALDTFWRKFDFRPGEAKLKQSAILQYITQVRVMKAFLLSFVRSCELFGQIADYHIKRGLPPALETGPAVLAIKDPRGDMASSPISESADITGVYTYINEKYWVIEVSTASLPENFVTYRIHGRLFGSTKQVKRFDLDYDHGKIRLQNCAGNSIRVLPGLQVQKHDRSWQVKLPVELTAGMKSVFLNVDSSIGPVTIDKTAWRMLKF